MDSEQGSVKVEAPDGESSDAEVSSSSQTMDGIHKMVNLLKQMISDFLNQIQREQSNMAASSPDDAIQITSIASSSQSALEDLSGSITELANSLGGLSSFCGSLRHRRSYGPHSSVSNITGSSASSTGDTWNSNGHSDGIGSDDESGGITTQLRTDGILPKRYTVSSAARRNVEGHRGHKFEKDGQLEYSSTDNDNNLTPTSSKRPGLRQRKPKKLQFSPRKSGKICVSTVSARQKSGSALQTLFKRNYATQEIFDLGNKFATYECYVTGTLLSFTIWMISFIL